MSKKKIVADEPTVYTWALQYKYNERFCWYNDVFSDKEVEMIDDMTSSLQIRDARFSKIDENVNNYVIDHSVRKTEIVWLPSNVKENQWLFQKLTEVINAANVKYFNYHLDYIENLQYSIYEDGGFYQKHIDSSYQSPGGIRKLSFVLHLTDDTEYEGGDLLLHIGESPTKMPRKKGTIMFFPSYTLHEVTPVTKGTRKTLVGWVLGPEFK